MGFDGATVLGIGLIVGGLGLLVTAVTGLGRRYGLFDRRRRRRARRVSPVRPQRTERPPARRDANHRNANLGNANLGRTNPALRPRAGDQRLRGNERLRPIVDPRRFPPGQSSPIQSATPARRVPVQPDAVVDTVLLQPVPAWSQPAPAIRRDPPRNDPPRTDLITAPVAPTTVGIVEPETEVLVQAPAQPAVRQSTVVRSAAAQSAAAQSVADEPERGAD